MKLHHLLLLSISYYANFAFAGFLGCQLPQRSSKPLIGCNVDLTVAIDMSSSMGSDSNIVKLSTNILSFLSTFNFENSNVAGISFGGSVIEASRYMNKFNEICEFIHSTQEQSIQIGNMGAANLSEVFRIYEVSLLNANLHKNYINQKVLALFTAITDKESIETAKIFTKQLKASGIQIVIINLNPTKSHALKGLGSVLYSSNSLAMPSAFRKSRILCPNLPLSTPSTPLAVEDSDDPRPNETGTPCSTNVTQAWLDIVLVIDVSNAMTSRNLQEFAGEIFSILMRFQISQFGDHSSRVAIVTYSTNVAIRYSFDDVTNLTALQHQLLQLRTYANPNDSGINVQSALQVSYNLIKTQMSNRVPVILLVGAAYNPYGFSGAEQIATVIKDDGIRIITISFDASDGVLPAEFELLSSPGYSYISSQDGLYGSLLLGFTQINCFCPQGKHQFRIYNEEFKNYTVFADCIWGNPSEAKPSFVKDYGCTKDGIIAAIQSQDKLDFVSDNVISIDTIGKKQFTVGLHVTDSGWKWWGYGKSEFSIEKFPDFSPNVGDTFGYLNNSYGLTWEFLSGGDVSRPYLCELRACDAENVCKYWV